jgi:hypothetical protein
MIMERDAFLAAVDTYRGAFSIQIISSSEDQCSSMSSFGLFIF